MRNMACITLLLFLLSASLVSADNKKLHVKNYQYWHSLPSEELFRRGNSYYDKWEQMDSAMLCYSIIASRYYETSRKDTSQLKLIVRSMNQMSILYMFHYRDYQQTYAQLLMAQEIAEKYHFSSTLVSINTNLANLFLLENTLTDSGEIDERTLKQHRKAYYAAIKEKRWEAIIPATFNYATLGDDERRAKQVVADLKAYHRLQMPDSILGKPFLQEFCLGIEANARKEQEKALAHFNQALALVKDYSILTEQVIRNSIRTTTCRLLIRMGRDDEALAMIKGLLTDAKKKGDHPMMYVYELALSGYYKHVGNQTEAEKHELTAYRERNIVMGKNRLLEAGQTEFLFQINKMNEEMKELSFERRIQQIVIISIALLTLLFIYVAMMLYRRWRKTQENNCQLYQRTQDLLAAEEEHRRQILDYETQLKQLAFPSPPKGNTNVLQGNEAPSETVGGGVKYRKHPVSEEENSELLHRILYIMETSEEIFSNDFSLDRLTELVDGRTSNYVSQAINQLYHRTFNDMVNEFRIREACRRLNDPEHYGHLSNDFLAQGLGFKSYPNFVRNFKKFTGLTPSEFQKQLKEKQINDKTVDE